MLSLNQQNSNVPSFTFSPSTVPLGMLVTPKQGGNVSSQRPCVGTGQRGSPLPAMGSIPLFTAQQGTNEGKPSLITHQSTSLCHELVTGGGHGDHLQVPLAQGAVFQSLGLHAHPDGTPSTDDFRKLLRESGQDIMSNFQPSQRINESESLLWKQIFEEVGRYTEPLNAVMQPRAGLTTDQSKVLHLAQQHRIQCTGVDQVRGTRALSGRDVAVLGIAQIPAAVRLPLSSPVGRSQPTQQSAASGGQFVQLQSPGHPQQQQSQNVRAMQAVPNQMHQQQQQSQTIREQQSTGLQQQQQQSQNVRVSQAIPNHMQQQQQQPRQQFRPNQQVQMQSPQRPMRPQLQRQMDHPDEVQHTQQRHPQQSAPPRAVAAPQTIESHQTPQKQMPPQQLLPQQVPLQQIAMRHNEPKGQMQQQQMHPQSMRSPKHTQSVRPQHPQSIRSPEHTQTLQPQQGMQHLMSSLNHESPRRQLQQQEQLSPQLSQLHPQHILAKRQQLQQQQQRQSQRTLPRQQLRQELLQEQQQTAEEIQQRALQQILLPLSKSSLLQQHLPHVGKEAPQQQTATAPHQLQQPRQQMLIASKVDADEMSLPLRPFVDPFCPFTESFTSPQRRPPPGGVTPFLCQPPSLMRMVTNPDTSGIADRPFVKSETYIPPIQQINVNSGLGAEGQRSPTKEDGQTVLKKLEDHRLLKKQFIDIQQKTLHEQAILDELIRDPVGKNLGELLDSNDDATFSGNQRGGNRKRKRSTDEVEESLNARSSPVRRKRKMESKIGSKDIDRGCSTSAGTDVREGKEGCEANVSSESPSAVRSPDTVTYYGSDEEPPQLSPAIGADITIGVRMSYFNI